MVQLEWVDVDFAGFFFLPNLPWHPVQWDCFPCQDMKPGPQGLPCPGKTDVHVGTWNLFHRVSQVQKNSLFSMSGHETRSRGTVFCVRTLNLVYRDSQVQGVSGHETRSRGTPKSIKHGFPKSGQTRFSMSGHEIWSIGTPSYNYISLHWNQYQTKSHWRRLRFGGSVMTGKKNPTVVWPAMFFDWTFFFLAIIRGGSDLAGTLRPE